MLRPESPIILYAAGAGFGLPEASSYTMKSEIHLRMAGLPYRKVSAAPAQAPKCKLPYIRDGHAVVADSTFIRQHLEWSYGIDFDAGYDLAARATAWAMERMLEDHLGWAALRMRWLDPVNFARGPAQMIGATDQASRDQRRAQLQAEVASELHAHGIGRHSEEDIQFLATRSLYSLSVLLADRPFLLGDKPCGTDAAACAILAAIMTPFFSGPLREAALGFDNLYPYLWRMLRRYYPEFEFGNWPAPTRRPIAALA